MKILSEINIAHIHMHKESEIQREREREREREKEYHCNALHKRETACYEEL